MVAQTRKIKADCGVEPGASSAPPAIAQAELYQATRMPALPPMPSISSPKVTSSLVNTDVLAEGLKKFAGTDLAPYVLQVVLEGEARAGRDQRGFVVVGESAPQAADHERLHGGAGLRD
jgi:hypothetical protein